MKFYNTDTEYYKLILNDVTSRKERYIHAEQQLTGMSKYFAAFYISVFIDKLEKLIDDLESASESVTFPQRIHYADSIGELLADYYDWNNYLDNEFWYTYDALKDTLGIVVKR